MGDKIIETLASLKLKSIGDLHRLYFFLSASFSALIVEKEKRIMYIYTLKDALVLVFWSLILGGMIGAKIMRYYVRRELFYVTAEQIMEIVEEALRDERR